MAFYDRFVSWIRKMLGIERPIPPPLPPPFPPILKVYAYAVRVSGYVLPPDECIRKKDKVLNKNTIIQFELSFEDRPFFRTTISKDVVAEKRYKMDLENLVKQQEIASVRKKAFSYPVPKSDKFLLWEEYLESSPLSRGKIRKDYPNEFELGKPTFMVNAISFEPVEVFDVPSSKLKEFTATDEFIFKVYRPEDYPEQSYSQWTGSFTHKLS